MTMVSSNYDFELAFQLYGCVELAKNRLHNF
jgi:hypothetical protein